jgi:hypothetical protein
MLSDHFLQRWGERFPGRDMHESMGRAVRISTRKLVGYATPNGHGIEASANTTFWHDDVLNAMFVIAEDKLTPKVVTVLRATKPAKTVPAGKGRNRFAVPYRRNRNPVEVDE